MGQCAVTGGVMMCSFGVAPATLNVLPTARVTVEGRPAANISASAPFINIPPFGMCMSLANPAVAGATSAALGVLTPMPCTPMTSAPWVPGAAQTTIGGQPALVSGSTCVCSYGGVIQLTMPGAVRTMAN